MSVQKGSMYYLTSVPLQLSRRGAIRIYHTGDNTVIAWCFGGIWNSHWSMSVLYTNNLFMIAKCTYATPDPVQPDHQYLCVHCVYPICLVSHVPSLQPTYLFQHFAKFLSLFFPVKSSPTSVSPAQTLSFMS